MVFLSSCTACESCEWVLDAYKILGASKNDAAWKKKKKRHYDAKLKKIWMHREKSHSRVDNQHTSHIHVYCNIEFSI